MGQQSQQSQGSKGGAGQPYNGTGWPGYSNPGPGYGNPAQQGSFFSNGGSNRPIAPRQMDGYGSQFGMGGMFGQNQLARGGFGGPVQTGGGNPGGGGNPWDNLQFSAQSPFPSETFNPNAQPSNPGTNPGVQTFQNGNYANWGQPPQTNPPQGVTTFQNMYQNAGTLPPGSNPFPNFNPGPSGYFTNGY